MRVIGLVLLASFVQNVLGHIALWDPAMFGWDPNDPNQQEPVIPLMDLPFEQWWFHGYKNKPPAANTFMTLPAGGVYKGQVACNKALTTFGQNPSQQTGIYACDGDGPQGGIGAMHTADQWGSPNPTDVKGCGLAIAYTSDANAVQPQDFAVISTNYTCPWFKAVDFQIPSDIPACPEAGCLCSWGWIHADDAGSEQMFHLVYRCKVDAATGTTPIPAAKTANKCHYPSDTSNCTVGAKQPHYWFQAERNNNPQGQYDPPFFNGDYGFMNGAQTDLFATASESGNSSNTSPAPPVSSSSAAAVDPNTAASSASSSSSSSVVPTSPTAVGNVDIATTGTVSSSMTSSSTSDTPSSSGGSCKQKKRALSRTNDPQALKGHQARAAKRAERAARRRLVE